MQMSKLQKKGPTFPRFVGRIGEGNIGIMEKKMGGYYLGFRVQGIVP